MTIEERLVLFDIDGTLLTIKGQTEWIWIEAIKKFFGIKLDKVVKEGLIKTEILDHNLSRFGVSKENIRENLPEFKKFILEKYKDMKYELIDGAEEVVKILKRKDVPVGILTGNTEGRAFMKLEKCGLHVHFDFGAFGDEADTREELVPIAIRKARSKYGKDFVAENVVIVGDTIHDVRCGKGNGAKVVAISSMYSKESKINTPEALRKAGADAVFESFSDPEKVVNVILKL